MKRTVLLICVFIAFSCKSRKSVFRNTAGLKSEVHSIKTCSEQSVCTIEIFKNAKIPNISEITQEAPKVEKGSNYVVVYQLKRITPPNTADGHHRELLFFEFDKNTQQAFLTNEALSDLKVTYGRFCYCKDGGTGYFSVDKGKLKLQRIKDSLYLDIDFKVGKVPQEVTEIKVAVPFKG